MPKVIICKNPKELEEKLKSLNKNEFDSVKISVFETENPSKGNLNFLLVYWENPY